MGYIITHQRAVSGDQTIGSEVRRESVRLHGTDGTGRAFSVELGLDQLDELDDVLADVRAHENDRGAFGEVERQRVADKEQALLSLAKQRQQLACHLLSHHHMEADELPSPEYVEDVAEHTRAVRMLREAHDESHAQGSYGHSTPELTIDPDVLVDKLYRHASI